jgi:hypothetical protein
MQLCKQNFACFLQWMQHVWFVWTSSISPYLVIRTTHEASQIQNNHCTVTSHKKYLQVYFYPSTNHKLNIYTIKDTSTSDFRVYQQYVLIHELMALNFYFHFTTLEMVESAPIQWKHTVNKNQKSKHAFESQAVVYKQNLQIYNTEWTHYHKLKLKKLRCACQKAMTRELPFTNHMRKPYIAIDVWFSNIITR